MRIVNDLRVDPRRSEERLGRKIVSFDQTPDDLAHAGERCVFHGAWPEWKSGDYSRSTGRPDRALAAALNIFRREHKQHVERSNDVRSERIAREERPPRRPIRSSKHMHLDRMERFAARVAEDAVFRAKPGVIHFAILIRLLRAQVSSAPPRPLSARQVSVRNVRPAIPTAPRTWPLAPICFVAE